MYFKVDGKVVHAMDALFGLPRKKSTGVSYQDPLHADLFFCDQFVAESKSTKTTPNVTQGPIYMSLY